MMYATKIIMQQGCSNSNSTQEIAEIYIDCKTPRYYTKAEVYSHLKKHPDTIKVKISPYPFLIPAVSSNGEKYVRSAPNDTEHDNLLELPRMRRLKKSS